jgi:hypothetical protein
MGSDREKRLAQAHRLRLRAGRLLPLQELGTLRLGLFPLGDVAGDAFERHQRTGLVTDRHMAHLQPDHVPALVPHPHRHRRGNPPGLTVQHRRYRVPVLGVREMPHHVGVGVELLWGVADDLSHRRAHVGEAAGRPQLVAVDGVRGVLGQAPEPLLALA